MRIISEKGTDRNTSKMHRISRGGKVLPSALQARDSSLAIISQQKLAVSRVTVDSVIHHGKEVGESEEASCRNRKAEFDVDQDGASRRPRPQKKKKLSKFDKKTREIAHLLARSDKFFQENRKAKQNDP